MDSERRHRSSGSTTTSTTSELFICFTSRLSSSSMKLSSKSVLSPAHNREPSQISLSSSLSRRLRPSGSIKGGASPMFPSVGKKRASFDNPEPTSPKVTCIGQVRVKTKKQGRKMRLNSLENAKLGALRSHSLHNQQQDYFTHKNQRWVHLPLTICEGLRAFGAELSCFLPCRSSCVKGKKEESNSCGCFVWDAKGREIELVVGEEEEVEMRESRRRHVFEDVEIREDDEFEGRNEGRVSICIPPKNALLLMRCRSDPVKMQALVNRFCESPIRQKDEDEDDEEEEERNREEGQEAPRVAEGKKNECEMAYEKCVFRDADQKDDEEAATGPQSETEDKEAQLEMVYEKCVFREASEEIEIQEVEADSTMKAGESPGEKQESYSQMERSSMANPSILAEEQKPTALRSPEEAGLDPEEQELELTQESDEHKEEIEAEQITAEKEVEIKDGRPSLSSSFLASLFLSESEEKEEEKGDNEEVKEEKQAEGEANDQSMQENQRITGERPRSLVPGRNNNSGRHSTDRILPECLLLMMYEPKLSMEVSKETWVCSTDFIRWLPERHINKKKTEGGGRLKNRLTAEPPRSSCHYPSAATAAGGVSMANGVEQKPVSSKAYEPLALTRCKSEPMRSSAKFAALEPHRAATLGVGAAGVGF